MLSDQDILADLLIFSYATRRVFEDEILARLKGSGINAARLSILRLLSRRGKQTVNSLARFLDLSKAAASQNIDWLVRQEYATRHTNPNDRRTVWVRATDRGKKIIQIAEQRQLENLRKFLDNLSPDLRSMICSRLGELSVSLIEISEARNETCLQCCTFGTASCIRGPDGDGWVCSIYQKSQPSGAENN